MSERNMYSRDGTLLLSERMPPLPTRVSSGRHLSVALPLVGVIVAAFFITFKLSFLPDIVSQLLKVASIAILLLLYSPMAFKRYKRLCWVAVFGLAVVFATLASKSSLPNVAYAIVYGLGICAMFSGFYVQRDKFGYQRLAKTAFWLLLIVCLLNDASILLAPSHHSDSEYLLGSKFSAGYLHLILLTLYLSFITDKRGLVLYNRGFYVILFLESAYILTLADAMTCLVAISLFFVLSLLPSRFTSKLSIGWLLMTVLAVVNVIYFGTGMMLQNPVISDFVQNTLGRNLTLTGRTQIYEALGQIYAESPIFGFGYGNSVVAAYVGWGNAQNGIMELLVNYGLLGVAAFSLMVIASFPNARGPMSYRRGAACAFLAFILASLTEITFSSVFMLYLALFSSLATARPNPDERRI